MQRRGERTKEPGRRTTPADGIPDERSISTPLSEPILTCFLSGTRILTPEGEVPIESLQIGDLVTTQSGELQAILWVGRRTFSSEIAFGDLAVQPVLIREGAISANVPWRDLRVSPQHGISVDGELVTAIDLVNGTSIIQEQRTDEITYLHLEFNERQIIFADGALAESFVERDGNRREFDNADEYFALYADDGLVEASTAHPQVEFDDPLGSSGNPVVKGDELYGKESEFDEAGEGPADEVPGYVGNIDLLTRERIEGWAWDNRKPGAPLTLLVLDQNEVAARIVANRYRKDLEDSGISDGRHAFSFVFPGPLTPLTRHVIQLVNEADGVPIHDTPLIIEPSANFDEALENAVGAAVAGVSEQSERERILHFLSTQSHVLLQQMAETEGGQEARLIAKQLQRRWGRGADIALKYTEALAKRALIIDDLLPTPDQDAGSNAILSHCAALQSLGYEISFAGSAEFDPTVQSRELIEARGIRVCRIPYYASVEEILRNEQGCFDVIYIHRAGNAAKYLALARQYGGKARLIYSVADLHCLRLGRQAQVEGRPEVLAYSRRMQLIECMGACTADVVVTHSHVEAQWLKKAIRGCNVKVVPWGIPLRQSDVPWEDRQGVAFIANYAHQPNLDAARFLLQKIMPLVWERLPAIECLVVGSRMPAAMRKVADERIKVLGHVRDLSEIFERVRLTVAPLRFGAGIKGKVLDSFAAGVPCVMSPVAAEGISTSAQLAEMTGSDAAQIAERIIHLHQSRDAWERAAATGIGVIKSTYTQDAVIALMETALNRNPAVRADASRSGTPI